MLTFAIAIPNYNQSHFLPWALESLRHQSVPFNVALMDGGSSDNFQSVAKAYSDVITHLESGPDGGQAAAIKKGKASVSGDIVSWLNADDYYFPGALDKVAAAFEAEPDVDVIFGNAVHVTAEGLFQSYFFPIQEFDARDLTRSCFICQPACFVRREAYEKIGGLNPGLKYTMDWDLWHRLSVSGAKFKYIRELLAAVRYYDGTKTMSGDYERYREIWRIERKYGWRMVPVAWAGFYRHDLSLTQRKTFLEKFTLKLLDQLRHSKKKLFRSRGSKSEWNQTLYGFHRWEPLVERTCTIHLPWYGARQWQTLYLNVDPIDRSYMISVNDIPCHHGFSGPGRLRVECPPITAPYRKISVGNPEHARWRFLGFSADLAGAPMA
ncbi:MAG: glycosyltransferase [Deltaproteobacteria bacterium]|nr:glycosyltransferase [Deltaproteobacteria bacterium]